MKSEKVKIGKYLTILADFGADNRDRTCMVAHRILNPARLPIPPHPHVTVLFYHPAGGLSRAKIGAVRGIVRESVQIDRLGPLGIFARGKMFRVA